MSNRDFTVKTGLQTPRLLVNTASSNVSIDFNTTDGIRLPSGNTGQRPASAAGTVRYNTETSSFEIFSSGLWSNVGTSAGNIVALDDISSQFGGANTTFTLTTDAGATEFTPISAPSLRVAVNYIVQPTNTYSVSANTIIFTEAPLSTDTCEIVALGVPQTLNTIADGTVTTVKLADSSVTSVKLADSAANTVKIADSAITYAKLNSALVADEDNMISDSATKIPTQQSTKAYIDSLLYARRNYIINPGMRISQENGTASGTTSSYYPADQWVSSSVHDGTLTYAQVASATPGGSTHRLRLTVTTGDASLAAGQFARYYHNVEGSQIADFLWGTASARDIIVRFGFKGPAGTYAIAIRNAAYNRSFVRGFTIAGGDANVDTVQTLTIPGDTSGTWPTTNVLGMEMSFTIAVGSDNQSTADVWTTGGIGTSSTTNGIATTGAVFELFDVGMYLDPNSTGVAPDFVLPSLDDDLIACMRYAQKYLTPPLRGVVTSSAAGRMAMMLPVTMRVAPTATLSANLPIFDGTTVTTASISVAYNTTQSIEFDMAASGMATGRAALIYTTGSATMLLNARM